MTLDEYQTEARRTAPRSLDAYPREVRETFEGGRNSAARYVMDAAVFALGLAGEAGEVCDLIKKMYGHGKPYDRGALVKEFGDVLWYLSNLADAHSITLEEVAEVNVAKLRARYPEGFSAAAAAAKADEKVMR